MTLKKLFIAIPFICMMITPAAMAQKKSFTLENLLWGGDSYWNYQPKTFSTTWWGDKLVKQGVDNCKLLTEEKGRKTKETVLFTLENINACKGIDLNAKPYSLQNVKFPDGKKTEVIVSAAKKVYLIDWKAKKVLKSREIPEGSSNRDMNLKSGNEAYVCNNNLYVITPEGKKLLHGANNFNEIMEENRKELNKQLPQYSQITAIELVANEFEKTPKRSIKRFMYK